MSEQAPASGQAIDPESLDAEALNSLVESLDAGTLNDLVSQLDSEAINKLVERADPETAKRLIRKVDPGTFDLSMIDPSVIDAEIFDTEMVSLVVGVTPQEKLAEAMNGPLRDVIVTEVFRRMPERIRPSAAATQATLAWTITRPEGEPDRYVVHLESGSCRVEPGTHESPRVALEMNAVTFLRLVTGNENPVTAFMSGLITIQGDLMFAATVPTLFDIPTGAGDGAGPSTSPPA
jgi:putative sterol carrier protein